MPSTTWQRLLPRCVLTPIAASFLAIGLASANTLVGTDAAGLTFTRLYDISITTGLPSNQRILSTAPNLGAGAISSESLGTPYAVSQLSGFPPGSKLFTFDPITLTSTFVADMTPAITVEGDIAVDPTAGTLYAVSGAGHLFTRNRPVAGSAACRSTR